MKKLFIKTAYKIRVFRECLRIGDEWIQPRVQSGIIRLHGFDAGRELIAVTPEKDRSSAAFIMQGTAMNPHKQGTQDQYDWYIGFSQGAEFQPYCHMPLHEWMENERNFREEQKIINMEILNKIRPSKIMNKSKLGSYVP